MSPLFGVIVVGAIAVGMMRGWAASAAVAVVLTLGLAVFSSAGLLP